MSRYELRVVGEELAFVRQEEAPPPVRAKGFLRFVPGKHDELIVEVRNGEVLVYVREKPVRIPRRGMSA